MMNRRSLLGIVGSSIITLPDAGQAAANDSIDTLTAWLRLAGALDDRLVIWWLSGQRYGVVDARSTLLYGMQVGIFQRFFAQADGSRKIAMFELTYYTDLASGAALTTWDNPYTGATNTVRHVRLGPEIRLQTDQGQFADPDTPGLSAMLQNYRASLGPLTVHDDTVWIPTSVEGEIGFAKPGAPTLTLNHYTTAMGRWQDARNPALLSAPCTLQFQNVIRWEPWMQMSDHPGHLMSRAAGRKLARMEDLPADYRAIAELMHPQFIADPLAALARVVARI